MKSIDSASETTDVTAWLASARATLSHLSLSEHDAVL